MNKQSKFVVGWSLNGDNIYLDDDEADERVVIIQFLDPYSKETQIKILKEMIEALERLAQPVTKKK